MFADEGVDRVDERVGARVLAPDRGAEPEADVLQRVHREGAVERRAAPRVRDDVAEEGLDPAEGVRREAVRTASEDGQASAAEGDAEEGLPVLRRVDVDPEEVPFSHGRVRAVVVWNARRNDRE